MYFLLVCGDEAKEACGLDQSCAGLEAGIEGGMHAAKFLWQERSYKEEWDSCWLMQAMQSIKAT
jgi:hypothetical protein